MTERLDGDLPAHLFSSILYMYTLHVFVEKYNCSDLANYIVMVARLQTVSGLKDNACKKKKKKERNMA